MQDKANGVKVISYAELRVLIINPREQISFLYDTSWAPLKCKQFFF